MLSKKEVFEKSFTPLRGEWVRGVAITLLALSPVIALLFLFYQLGQSEALLVTGYSKDDVLMPVIDVFRGAAAVPIWMYLVSPLADMLSKLQAYIMWRKSAPDSEIEIGDKVYSQVIAGFLSFLLIAGFSHVMGECLYSLGFGDTSLVFIGVGSVIAAWYFVMECYWASLSMLPLLAQDKGKAWVPFPIAPALDAAVAISLTHPDSEPEVLSVIVKPEEWGYEVLFIRDSHSVHLPQSHIDAVYLGQLAHDPGNMIRVWHGLSLGDSMRFAPLSS